MDYRDAGVDVEAGREFVGQISSLVRSTNRPGVIGGLGGFSGCFQLPTGFQEPVLVSGTDGVGTKLKIAQAVARHDTVGIDLVAMCVNDVLTSGAEPLFFLDYLATGKLDKLQLQQVVSGIAAGCKQANCALLGGETAEMPGFYPGGEYDVAGFCVGIVEKSEMLDGSQVKLGDVAVALQSSGIHSNGLSLVRKIIDEQGFSWSNRPESLGNKSLGEVFLTPTKIYVDAVLGARKSGLKINGMAHITGGGLPENLPRCLDRNQGIKIDPNSWSVPSVFQWLADVGSVSSQAMYNTFNMGIGFVLIVPAESAERAISYFQSKEISAFAIGEVISGSGELVGLDC
ncbi:phosphoribosylformylglycinamidine cyclo-ligase [Mastigocoleus testarum]|uniref:Phosphoribosylformylglycinamidine cyclo-ligase n=1 Tax=Mastigocoleus testarum BC008 TaxID=371196 RepID=A0A0V7ZJ89_9CYAN|nr:phosphoribosylformylglycinamidine cyclo-ligase [Mastigocoleus testarum]KST64305.1 phosphoribosylformylglycinamidine cyclo-ligase [Mastigocoleus testarum BC008]KST64358.1 phosphoribosylformylglycinamidine cyclo-ligase [Mastigocoleus testarum BC008]